MSTKTRSSEYDHLKKFWYEKLEQSGFVDIEDSKQRLKNPNIRTLGYANKEKIRDFFLKLDTFLTETQNLTEINRKVLELYSSGCRIKNIAFIVKRTPRTIHKIITKYKKIILNE